MGRSGPQTRPALGLSLRLKIIVTFFVISFLVSVGLGLATYRILNASLLRELQDRVRNLAVLGAMALDKPALGRLADAAQSAASAGQPMSGDQAAAIEGSRDFRRISEQLNGIRRTDEEVVGYIYTFLPTPDENTALFLVDADLLPSMEARAAGQEVPEEELTHFASPFDVSQFQVARRAMSEQSPTVESEYSYDEAYDVYSLSGYAPVFDDQGDRVLAFLGVDLFNTDARAILRRTATLTLFVAGVALLLALASSVIFGYLFTHGIIRLDQVVRRFGEKDLEVRAEIRSRDEVGRLGLSFNRMADMIQRYNLEMVALLAAYGRFVPHDFLRFLNKASINEVELGDQVEKEMTVLFSDIRSFTALSESMTPQENFRFLNSYLSRVGPEIRAHGGFIDKYIGDSIMSLFPQRPDDAVKAAIAMRRALAEYNGHRRSSGYDPISIGVAINTGSLMLGTIGEKQRMDGSVIADAVNLCSRLESLSRIYGEGILITSHTLSRLEHRREFHVRFVDRVRVRGRKESIPIYEVYDADPPQHVAAKDRAHKIWTRAMDHYYAGRFRSAFLILRRLRAASPPDGVIELYLRRCARFIRHGVPEGWQGVEVIDAK